MQRLKSGKQNKFNLSPDAHNGSVESVHNHKYLGAAIKSNLNFNDTKLRCCLQKGPMFQRWCIKLLWLNLFYTYLPRSVLIPSVTRRYDSLGVSKANLKKYLSPAASWNQSITATIFGVCVRFNRKWNTFFLGDDIHCLFCLFICLFFDMIFIRPPKRPLKIVQFVRLMASANLLFQHSPFNEWLWCVAVRLPLPLWIRLLYESND